MLSDNLLLEQICLQRSVVCWAPHKLYYRSAKRKSSMLQADLLRREHSAGIARYGVATLLDDVS